MPTDNTLGEDQCNCYLYIINAIKIKEYKICT